MAQTSRRVVLVESRFKFLCDAARVSIRKKKKWKERKKLSSSSDQSSCSLTRFLITRFFLSVPWINSVDGADIRPSLSRIQGNLYLSLYRRGSSTRGFPINPVSRGLLGHIRAYLTIVLLSSRVFYYRLVKSGSLNPRQSPLIVTRWNVCRESIRQVSS